MEKIKKISDMYEYPIKMGEKSTQYKLVLYEYKKKYKTLVNIMRYSKRFEAWQCVYSEYLPYTDVQYYNKEWDATGSKALVLYSPPQGSGGFVSYIAFGSEDGTVKRMAAQDMLFQGSVFFSGTKLIQGSGNQFRVWKRIGDKLLLEPYKMPVVPGAVVVRYSITEEGNVVTENKEYYVPVGGTVQFIRSDFNDPTERLLVSGKCAEFLQLGVFKITCKEETEVKIIPNGYDWDKAAAIKIIGKS